MDKRAKQDREALNQQMALFGKMFPGAKVEDTGKEVVITIPKPEHMQEERLFDE